MPARSRPVVALLAALVLVLVVTGCSDDDGDGASDTSLIPPESTDAPSSTASTSTSSTSTSSSSTSTSTAPSQPTAFTAEARDAVNELEAAWETGDQARARAIAPGDVVDALFGVAPDGYEIQGCDTGEFETSSCTFRNRSTEAFISVNATRTDAGWQISTIDVNAD